MILSRRLYLVSFTPQSGITGGRPLPVEKTNETVGRHEWQKPTEKTIQALAETYLLIISKGIIFK